LYVKRERERKKKREREREGGEREKFSLKVILFVIAG
jgi:hypothetical protein